MNVSMQMPSTPEHDLVVMTAALRGVLLQRVENGIEGSGLNSYYLYILAKRLVFAGPLTAAELSSQLRQDAHAVAENLADMERQAMVRRDGEMWNITDTGRAALKSANDSGGQVLVDIREAIGASACDQLVAGMRDALTALRKVA